MPYLFRPEDLPPPVLRTELPTIVRERCENAQQISVWLAIRWLLSLSQRRAGGLGSREIAERAKINVKSVTGATAALMRLGLIEIVGTEQVGKLKQQRPIYRIPRTIEEENAGYTWQFLARYGSEGNEPPHENQLTLPLDSASPAALDPKTDQGLDPKTDQDLDPKTDQPDPNLDQALIQKRIRPDPKTDQGPDPKTDHRMDGCMDGRMDELRAPTREEDSLPAELSPPSSAPPPPPETMFLHHAGWVRGPVTENPEILWGHVCKQPSIIDMQHLALLAAEHDRTTDGYGWYWVCRAILAGSWKEGIHKVAKVKIILGRWRDTDSYGSDAAHMKEPHHEQQSRSASSRRDGAHRVRSGNSDAHRQPAHGGDGSAGQQPGADLAGGLTAADLTPAEQQLITNQGYRLADIAFMRRIRSDAPSASDLPGV